MELIDGILISIIIILIASYAGYLCIGCKTGRHSRYRRPPLMSRIESFKDYYLPAEHYETDPMYLQVTNREIRENDAIRKRYKRGLMEEQQLKSLERTVIPFDFEKEMEGVLSNNWHHASNLHYSKPSGFINRTERDGYTDRYSYQW